MIVTKFFRLNPSLMAAFNYLISLLLCNRQLNYQQIWVIFKGLWGLLQLLNEPLSFKFSRVLVPQMCCRYLEMLQYLCK